MSVHRGRGEEKAGENPRGKASELSSASILTVWKQVPGTATRGRNSPRWEGNGTLAEQGGTVGHLKVQAGVQRTQVTSSSTGLLLPPLEVTKGSGGLIGITVC